MTGASCRCRCRLQLPNIYYRFLHNILCCYFFFFSSLSSSSPLLLLSSLFARFHFTFRMVLCVASTHRTFRSHLLPACLTSIHAMRCAIFHVCISTYGAIMHPNGKKEHRTQDRERVVVAAAAAANNSIRNICTISFYVSDFMWVYLLPFTFGNSLLSMKLFRVYSSSSFSSLLWWAFINALIVLEGKNCSHQKHINEQMEENASTSTHREREREKINRNTMKIVFFCWQHWF